MIDVDNRTNTILFNFLWGGGLGCNQAKMGGEIFKKERKKGLPPNERPIKNARGGDIQHTTYIHCDYYTDPAQRAVSEKAS